MRVMVIVKASEASEAGAMPGTELIEAMGRYNEELMAAGILLAADGLHASSKGKRLIIDGANRVVVDGPFTPARELVAGFWLWQVKDMGEAVAWLQRCPDPMPGRCEIELRPLFEAADFGDAMTAELAERERGRCDEAAGR